MSNETKKTFWKKLNEIQTELNAPKNQYNSFGKYAYRNCEDILQAIKPHLKSTGLMLFVGDDIREAGDRVYIEATATITDGETSHSVKALARESLNKKGMDESQITGAASSYARKYALNGLLCIDDNKDSDTTRSFEYLIEDGSPIEFYGFISKLDENTQNELINSAPKGEKTKLKQQWKDKQNEGVKEIKRLIADINSGDDEVKEDAINSMNEQEKAVVREFMRATNKG